MSAGIKSNENRESPGTSDVSLKLIAAHREIRIQVMVKLFHSVLDGLAMPVEYAPSILVPIFKWKGDIRNCCCCGAKKLLEHGTKVLKRVLEKSLRKEQLMLRLSLEGCNKSIINCICVVWTQ